MVRRLMLAAALLAAATAVFLGPGASRAFACSNETGVFWSDADTAGNIIYPTYGSYAQITESDHVLKCTALDQFGNGQTVRELINGEFGHYAEVGWGMQICSNTGSKCQRAFYEYKWGNNTSYIQKYSYSCLNPGTREAWQMTYSGGNWNGYLQCYSSGTWYFVDWFPDSSNVGYADNEAFQNSNSSGASNEGDLQETHSVLQWLDSGGAWHGTSGTGYPRGIKCRYDTSNRWNGNWLSGSSFNFTTSSNGQGCSPNPAP